MNYINLVPAKKGFVLRFVLVPFHLHAGFVHVHLLEELKGAGRHSLTNPKFMC
jgi:hypothetical protein